MWYYTSRGDCNNMIQCEIPNCKNGARGRHISRKFNLKPMSLCTGHHTAMHRFERGQDRGIPISDLRKALGEKRWKEIMKQWTLKMGDDGYMHPVPKEQKEKVIFT